MLNTSKPENRGRAPSTNKTPTEVVKEAENFISQLPAVPSHYCRHNLTIIYKDYKKQIIDEKNKAPSSINKFKKIFHTFIWHSISQKKINVPNVKEFVTKRPQIIILKRIDNCTHV